MGVTFSGNEVIEVGVQIEKNGKDFYLAVAAKAKSSKASEMFKYLAGEEDKHIKSFEALISSDEDAGEGESYPGEYYNYLRTLADMNVFIKKNTGKAAGEKTKSDMEAIDMAVGFEKDSILFFHEMKNVVVTERAKSVVENLIKQEQEHLLKLAGIKSKI
jgi:rubrerythrin